MPGFDRWMNEVKPYQATLIYATDYMGNPSSMFGHTLLRLDPKDQQQLNLISMQSIMLPQSTEMITGPLPGKG